MSTITVTRADNEEMVVEVEFDEIADALGAEYIIGDGDNREFAYLAALALETHGDPSYSIEDTLIEFIRNESALEEVDAQDAEEIEILLQ